ncbi:ABC transporter permease [Kitasatospora sp. LaBMicrA B282]|uniref:ABC transporter permease n=1 Tax=Kitasatospora sp. LaBMicrA B282 TaxID=3420949 RepID=UPI003D0FC5B2
MSRADADTVTAATAETVAVAAGATAAGAGPAGSAAAPAGPRSATLPGFLSLFRSELTLTFRRARTMALLGVLAAVPILIGVVVRIETGHLHDGPNGPAFLAQVTQNGVFLTFTALATSLPIFLPMTVGVVAGDSVAGEAATGTLRYLLVAPAGRTRLLAAKFSAAMAFCVAATLAVALSGLIAGSILFPVGNVTLLSGDTIGLGAALLRVVLICAVVALSLAGLVAIGLFISTLTGSGIAAMASTVGLVIIVQVLDGFPQLAAIQPWLFTHDWLSFGDLLRQPMYWSGVWRDLGLQALYVAVFGSAAWARFTSRDITA